MNRVIKFRWWNSQRMVDGKDLNILLKNAHNLDWLMQYTGLTDKNGIEIYEGDIVKHVKFCPAPTNYGDGEPAWHEKEYKRIGKITITTSKGVTLSGTVEDWDYNEGTLIEKRRQYGNPGGWDVYSEVIGNIYENPELIK